MKFPQHGGFDVTYSGSILKLTTWGALNLETSKACIDKLNQCIQALNKQDYAVIVDNRKVEGLTADSGPVWDKAIEYWLLTGLRAMTRVGDKNAAIYKIFLQSFDSKIEQYVPFHFSENIDDAIHWLHSQGYQGFSDDSTCC